MTEPARSNEYWRMHHEARIAQRLCERTARLYRGLQTAATFLSVVGGSGVLAALAPAFPAWVSVAGACTLAIAGGAALALRPAERAAQNETDVAKYAALLGQSLVMSDAEFAQGLAQARESDAPEVDALRDVAYNDVMREIGRPDLVGPLGPRQRVIAALA